MPSHFPRAKVVSRLKSIGCTAAPHCCRCTLIVSKVTILILTYSLYLLEYRAVYSDGRVLKYQIYSCKSSSIRINKLQQELTNRDELIDVFVLNRNTDLLAVSNKTKSFAAEDVKNRKYLTIYFFSHWF